MPFTPPISMPASFSRIAPPSLLTPSGAEGPSLFILLCDPLSFLWVIACVWIEIGPASYGGCHELGI
jgi:hypothetical protein